MFLNLYYLKKKVYKKKVLKKKVLKKKTKKSITESNINYEYSLLEIYDKSDQPMHIKYFIIQSKKISSEFDLVSLSSQRIYS
jgi:hypothetical protein